MVATSEEIIQRVLLPLHMEYRESVVATAQGIIESLVATAQGIIQRLWLPLHTEYRESVVATAQGIQSVVTTAQGIIESLVATAQGIIQCFCHCTGNRERAWLPLHRE